MSFNQAEKDIVQNHWIDISQDPDFISQETGLDKNQVLGILKLLSKEGRIEGFDLNESLVIKKFNNFNY
jgi:hypothetical protein